MKIRDQKSIQIIHELLEENGNIPNNRNCELIVYQKAIEFEGNEGPEMMEELFHRNDWKNSWRNGIFSYHHYHSNTHEVLGIYSGYAEVVLGGEKGIDLQIEKGDVVILPAGTAHKKLSSGDNFACVGAYPDGRSYDMNYGKSGEQDEAKQNIKEVPMPEADPVYGKNGKLFEYWK